MEDNLKLLELQGEIDRCLNMIQIIDKTKDPYHQSILESYATLNNHFKTIYMKSIKLNEQVLIPKTATNLACCDCTLGLQATIYNNHVLQQCRSRDVDIVKKQDALKQLYSQAKEHPYLFESKKNSKRK